MTYENEFLHTTSFKLTKNEIIKFASQYDPHLFHLDDRGAKEFIFGGLIASGLHCIYKIWDQSPMDKFFFELIAGLGFTVRFNKPIYADIDYLIEQSIVDKKDDKKLDNAHIYKSIRVIKNDKHEHLLELESNEIIREN